MRLSVQFKGPRELLGARGVLVELLEQLEGLALLKDPVQMTKAARNQWAVQLLPASAQTGKADSITTQLASAEEAWEAAQAARRAAWLAQRQQTQAS